jgi:hypothetical protein
MNWDTTPEAPINDVNVNSNTYILVNGSSIDLNAGDDFVTVVKNVARDANFGKFRLFLDGNEISPASAPSTIEDGMHLELRPYDVAG